MNREPAQPGRSLVPSWYAANLDDDRYVDAEAALAERFPKALRAAAERIGPLRGLLLFLSLRGGERLALIGKGPGTTTALALEAWLHRGPPRAIVLELLPRPLPRSRLKRLAFRAWQRVVERPAIRRGMRLAQVLTAQEVDDYAALYGVPRERFRHVPWALRRGPAPEAAGVPATRSGVFSSGRADCDWETVFAAARGADWPLTVVCGSRDLPRVMRLNADARAEVLHELSRGEHDRRLAAASVYVLTLRGDGPSAGHVRLMAAVGAETPVIATDAPGLRGYVAAGETALVVPPRDSVALRAAIEHLLASPDDARRLAEAAAERAARWTYRDYFAAIGALIEEGRR